MSEACSSLTHAACYPSFARREHCCSDVVLLAFSGKVLSCPAGFFSSWLFMKVQQSQKIGETRKDSGRAMRMGAHSCVPLVACSGLSSSCRQRGATVRHLCQPQKSSALPAYLLTVWEGPHRCGPPCCVICCKKHSNISNPNISEQFPHPMDPYMETAYNIDLSLDCAWGKCFAN